jgi:hypothetical protein
MSAPPNPDFGSARDHADAKPADPEQAAPADSTWPPRPASPTADEGGCMSDAASTERSVRPWGHGFLVLILCLIAFSLFLLIRRGDYRYEKYLNLVVSLMLLFNHIAFQYTKTGWQSKVMKSVAMAWLAFGIVYILCLAWWVPPPW